MSQSNYKESNILFVGKIPSDWIVRSMRSLFTFGRGRVISNEEIADNVGEYPVYSSQTKNEGVLGYINTYDFNGEYVTWTTDGANAGTVFYREGKFNCTNVCGTIQPKKEGVVYLKLLPYYLNFATKEYVRYDINPKLMNNVMGDIPICFPESYSEQKYIVDYLDEQTSNINSIIAKNEELIRLLEEKRLSLINQVITKGLDHNVPMKDSGVEWIGEIPEHWDMMKISNIFNNIGSGTTPKSSNDEYYIDGNVNWLITGDLNDNYIHNTSTKITKKALHDTSALKIYPKESLVIAMYGATIGKLGILNIETCTNQACCVLSRSKIMNIKYTYYWFLGYRNEIISLSYGGGQPNISQDVIKNLKCIVPPFNEQKQIIDYLDTEITKINKTITKVTENINLLEEYKTSLIHHVVTGKIDVRGDEI